MRAIRDNETAANAMGKYVTKQHLLVFVLGSAVIGVAGAMMVTLDGQFTPTSYQPLRFTFLIWVMVIAGGSGNNWGAVLGGFLIWFFWIEAEPIGLWLMDVVTSGLPPTALVACIFWKVRRTAVNDHWGLFFTGVAFFTGAGPESRAGRIMMGTSCEKSLLLLNKHQITFLLP